MTGWRIGYVAAPAELMAGIAKVHQYGIMCAPTAAQFAAIEALRSGEPHVQAMRAEYDRRRRYMTDRFNEIGLALLRADGRLLLLPARDRCDRPGRRSVRRAAAARGARRRRARQRLRPVGRRPRPRLLRHRLRGDRGGDGPHRAFRRAATARDAASVPAARPDSRPDAPTTTPPPWHPRCAPMAAEVVRRAALRAGETVLDVGTGTGTAAALRAWATARRVIGLDAAPGHARASRAREAPGVDFVEADFSRLPLAGRVSRRRHRRPRPALRRRPRRRHCASGCASRARRSPVAVRARSERRGSDRRLRRGLRPLRHRPGGDDYPTRRSWRMGAGRRLGRCQRRMPIRPPPSRSPTKPPSAPGFRWREGPRDRRTGSRTQRERSPAT